MALVRASQKVVFEGYRKEIKRQYPFTKQKVVDTTINFLGWVECICDEKEVEEKIKEKIQHTMKNTKIRADTEEIWTYYRTYCCSGEFDGYPNREEFEIKVEYIRDWKMSKIIEELDGSQFAILCKELGISVTEAVCHKQ